MGPYVGMCVIVFVGIGFVAPLRLRRDSWSW